MWVQCDHISRQCPQCGLELVQSIRQWNRYGLLPNGDDRLEFDLGYVGDGSAICTHGDQCQSLLWLRVGWHECHDHGNGPRSCYRCDDRRSRRDERSSDQRDDDHGDNPGRQCRG